MATRRVIKRESAALRVDTPGGGGCCGGTRRRCHGVEPQRRPCHRRWLGPV